MKLLAACAVFLASVSSFAQIPESLREIPGQKEFSGTLFVQTSDPATVGRILPYTESILPQINAFVLETPDGYTDPEFLAFVKELGTFSIAEPNWTVFPAFTPNDPSLNLQWQHAKMRTSLAYDHALGSPNVVVAICDTGVDTVHSDLAAAIVPGYNAVDRLPQPAGAVNDINGHGTSCAGLAAQVGNNSLFGAGISWGSKIMPIRVSNLTNGSASYANIFAGAIWAAENGAKVVSVSYSGPDFAGIETTGAQLRSLGVLFLWAAGNDGRNLTAFDHPNATIVTGLDDTDGQTGFAFGPAVDICAPGRDVFTTRRNNAFGAFSGTSAATPVAAGLAALVFSANPDLTPEEVETALELGCQDLQAAGEDNVLAWGRIDAYRSVKLAKRGTMVFRPDTSTYYELVQTDISPLYAMTAAERRTYFGLNGVLASVPDAATNSFLVGSFGSTYSSAIIGGFQADGQPQPNGWYWQDGSTWSYSNWFPGEPNGGIGEQRAIRITGLSGQWENIPLTETATSGFVVAYESSLQPVNLQVLLGDVIPSGLPVNVTLKQGSTVLSSGTVSAGNFSVMTDRRGEMELVAEAPGWLRRRLSFDFTGQTASSILVLPNGDIDRDQEVGPGDFAELAPAFLSVDGDPNWNPDADLDRDGEVGPGDFGILATNFLLTGDPA